MAEKTTYIILRKTPFQESSLIVSGLSPEFGRLDFLLKGARGTGARKFPFAELFRKLSIEFRPPRFSSTLSTLLSQEPAASFDAIAMRTGNYLQMCAYAAFLLKHTKSMLEAPDTFHALEVLLSRLTEVNEPGFPIAAAKLMFLWESGFVPETHAPDAVHQEQMLHLLLQYASNLDLPEPDMTEDYQKKLILWIDELCRYHALC